MDTIILALGPAFAAGFALQQLLELFDSLIEKLAKDNKKLVVGIISLIFGLSMSFGAGMRALAPLGFAGGDFWDAFITALIISAGTEGINSIMKYLGYSKDAKGLQARKQ